MMATSVELHGFRELYVLRWGVSEMGLVYHRCPNKRSNRTLVLYLGGLGWGGKVKARKGKEKKEKKKRGVGGAPRRRHSR
jgi:hypothetical protein